VPLPPCDVRGRIVRWFGSRAELASPDCVVGVTFDLAERKSAEEEIWRTANHHSLTGLPNRSLFHRHLERLGRMRLSCTSSIFRSIM
jgi:predicted signal transduction protein with EAL and GGDEF domain